MIACCWKSRLGFTSWSSLDSIFCTLCWCPGLLGGSASRLLCFLPREVATLLWCLPHLSSFLHRAIAFCHSSKLNLPPNPCLSNSLAKSFFISFISVSAKLFSGLPHSFSHSFANSKACKINDLKKKMASSPILKMGGCGIPISYNIHLWCNFI